LIRDLLDLSRIGRIAGEKSAIDIEDILDEISQDFRFRLEERNVILSIYKPLPKPYGDRERIKQVFENLISNAVKFMGNNDNCHIEVGVVNGIQEEHFTGFYVRDNGIGIDKKYFGNIFQIFHRLNDIDTEGTGVGLTIVKKIIEHHGGRIWIDSAVGRGSTFYFTLPDGVN
jgi:signal transduction histidine kinase